MSSSKATVLGLVLVSLLGACKADGTNDDKDEDERGSVGPANPAAVYCSELGYTLTDSDCVFPDGSTCEQWSFWNGQCGQAHSYCNRHGGQVANEQRDMGDWTSKTAICTLDGKKCDEHVFMKTAKCE
jgi:putative hemolysin